MAFWPNVRFSLRILRKHPKPTGIAVFSLAIAMAVATTGLSAYNALLVKPPAVSAPDRLLTVYTTTPSTRVDGMSYQDYEYYRDNNSVFSGVAAAPYSISVTLLKYDGRPIRALANGVSDNYFSVLGVQPFLGQVFARGDDDKPTASAVLSYSFWKLLGGDPHILGKTLTLNPPLTIIGVAPKNFEGTMFGAATDVWFPFSANAQNWRADRNYHYLSLFARLKPGATPEQAGTDLRVLSSQLATAHPDIDSNRLAALTNTTMLPPSERSSARLLCSVILVVVALVLFAASSNVANLLLALVSVRRHEMLVRAALGATRIRLIAQLLIDSMLISAAGGILGTVLASWGLEQFLRFKVSGPFIGTFALPIDLRPDVRVLALTVALIFAVGLATALTPGLRFSTPNLASALSGEIAIGGTRKNHLRNVLVLIQVAVCTMVLSGVGLCLRSLRNLEHVDPGFSARNIAVLDGDWKLGGYTDEQQRSMYATMRLAASQVYGVESVSLASGVHLGGGADHQRIRVAAPTGQTDLNIAYYVVDANYFATLGIKMLSGRGFAPSDTITGQSLAVTVINKTMADKYWPGEDPIGKQVRTVSDNQPFTVIGVVGDAKIADLDEAAQSFMYMALDQNHLRHVVLVARTHGDPRQWLVPLSQSLLTLDPQSEIYSATTDQFRDFSLYFPRLTLICVGVFGALASLLAAVGVYGSIFYAVGERRKELGIRVALGAEPRDLWRMILRQTSTVTSVGVCLGILGGSVASAFVRSLLYGIRPLEWTVLFAVAVAMALMIVSTAYSAARPWMRVDPMVALRHE